MALPRTVSLATGLATVGLVWGIYNSALPTIADIRVADPEDRDVAAAERTATWTAAAIVSGVSLIAKDPTVFVLGGSMVVVLAWWHRHSNHFNPSLGSAIIPSSRQVQVESMQVDAGYSPAG